MGGEVVNVATIQIDCYLGDIQKNLLVTKNLVDQAVENENAKLIVLPELFATGYRLDQLYKNFAEPLDGPLITRLQSWCTEHDIWISAAIIELSNYELYDTAVLVSPAGLEGYTRKKTLWGKEAEYFNSSDQHGDIYETPIGKVGLAICYEVGFPEIIRNLAVNGAEVILVPSAFGMPRLYAWDIATRSRALENGCFLVASNRIGIEKDSEFCGHSRIVSPQGKILTEINNFQGWVSHEIKLKELYKQRERLPYLKELDHLKSKKGAGS